MALTVSVLELLMAFSVVVANVLILVLIALIVFKLLLLIADVVALLS